MCKCVKVRLKPGRARWWKNWEGKKVWTTSADDVDWVEFEPTLKLQRDKPSYSIYMQFSRSVLSYLSGFYQYLT